jgi:predicted regulator of Ras-like GTPase activity (Roadblock/LC7/MglB family)
MEAARLRDEQRRDMPRTPDISAQPKPKPPTPDEADTEKPRSDTAQKLAEQTPSATQTKPQNSAQPLFDHASSQARHSSTPIEPANNNAFGRSGDDERSKDMALSGRSSTEVLEDLLKVPGVDAVVVVGRDGFVIEMAGSSTRVTIDALGAALAHAINGIEEMGNELRIDVFSDLFIEYGRAVLMCRPVGDAVAVLVTPDASKLGIIRHKAKPFFEELKHLF